MKRLNFADKNQIISIKVCDQLNLSNELNDILHDAIELATKSVESLSTNVFKKKLQREIKNTLNRKEFGETAFKDMINSEKVFLSKLFNLSNLKYFQVYVFIG